MSGLICRVRAPGGFLADCVSGEDNTPSREDRKSEYARKGVRIEPCIDGVGGYRRAFRSCQDRDLRLLLIGNRGLLQLRSSLLDLITVRLSGFELSDLLLSLLNVLK